MNPKRPSNHIPVLVISLIVLVGGFALSFLYDLAINQALYDPFNGFAIFMEAFGWLPVYSLPIAFCILIATRPDVSPPKQVGSLVALMMMSIILGVMSQRYLAGHVELLFPYWYLFPLTNLVLYLIARANTQRIDPYRNRLIKVTFAATVFIAVSLVIIHVVKTIWMRSRFDDMLLLENFATFTPWYLPFGNGGTSFPSGHTANVTMLLSFIFFTDVFPRLRKYRPLIYGSVSVYVALMAASRIIIGRHFLSDVLAAAFIVLAIFLIFKNTSWYRRTVIEGAVR